MKSLFKSLMLVSTLSFAVHANASIVQLDFSNVGVDASSTFTFSSAGDVWRASNVRMGGGPAMDALFTITGVSPGVGTDNVRFVDESARGNNMRIRVGNPTTIGNASVFITISFVNAGSSDAYTGWTVGGGEQLVAQFSDLDSDPAQDRADFAGARATEYDFRRTSDDVTPGSSLLEFIESPTYADDYTVAIMEEPWGPQGNVFDTDPASQSPVTAAFFYDVDNMYTRNSIDIVVGQRSNSTAADRHIDIDMTPDFVIIPEPSTALLGGLGMLLLFRRRR